MRSRNHRRYELFKGNRLVYVGITNNHDRREQEHESEGKQFSRMDLVGPTVTKETAQKWERERLETYRKNHKGENPKYNISDLGGLEN